MKLEQVCEVSDENKHSDEIESIAGCGDKIFSAADDGIIKVWSSKDLSLLHEIKAHDYAINHLLVGGDRLYSASMDQTVKSWQLDTWKLKATFVGHENTPRRLATDGDYIFCGDDSGHVIKWTKDGEKCSDFELVEEVWDMYIRDSLLYTIRDRGLTVTEANRKATTPPVIRSLEGRAPIYINKEHLVILDKSGTVFQQYENPPACNFLRELKGHERIATLTAGYGNKMFSSGYDEKLFAWNLSTGELLASIPLKGCPNAIYVINESEIYVGGPGGALSKLKLTS